MYKPSADFAFLKARNIFIFVSALLNIIYWARGGCALMFIPLSIKIESLKGKTSLQPVGHMTHVLWPEHVCIKSQCPVMAPWCVEVCGPEVTGIIFI